MERTPLARGVRNQATWQPHGGHRSRQSDIDRQRGIRRGAGRTDGGNAMVVTGPAAGALAIWLIVAATIGGAPTTTTTNGGGAVAGTTPLTAVDLGSYQWQNRLILIFGPDDADANYREQAAAFAGREAEIADRDLLIGHFAATGAGDFAGQQVAPAASAALRRQLDVPDGAFQMLLIGKDGGVKLRADRPLSAERVFATIDSMPMRQREQR